MRYNYEKKSTEVSDGKRRKGFYMMGFVHQAPGHLIYPSLRTWRAYITGDY